MRIFVDKITWKAIGFLVIFCMSHGFFFASVLGQGTKQLNPNTFYVGSERQLFIDDSIISDFGGGASLVLHKPSPREIVLECDKPWEGSGSLYFTIFQDEKLYRMYYRGTNISRFTKGHETENDDTQKNRICYAESTDGIHWYKPDLNIVEFNNSKNNNIILSDGLYDSLNLNLGDNASFFRDKNVNSVSDGSYKAVVFSRDPENKGLLVFKSSDGVHWKPLQNKPVITNGAFDSQNLIFWDEINRVYRAYWRILKNGVRDIRTAESDDLIHWKKERDLVYKDTVTEQLYTNQIIPYFRAPQLMIGFPTRYVDRGWTESMKYLPELNYRKQRSSVSPREGTAITEGLIMASQDGIRFRRWNEAFLRPGIERPGTWNYGQQYMGWGLVKTRSDLSGGPDEISLYASESYKSDYFTGTRLRRYTIRMDGFVSVHAPFVGGNFSTKPVGFNGNHLFINFSSSAAGEIRVELRDIEGRVVPGYSKEQCYPIFGDSINRMVEWESKADLKELKNKPVRIVFYMKDADLYSFKFDN